MLLGKLLVSEAASNRARVKARRNAMQAIYQWHMTNADMHDVIKQFKEERSEINKADIDYFEKLLHGVKKNTDTIRNNYQSLLDRPLEEIDPVELSILDLGVYELLYHPELPWRVVINEYVELAKMFGAEDSYKYVNKIIDQAAQSIRASEIKAFSQ